MISLVRWSNRVTSSKRKSRAAICVIYRWKRIRVNYSTSFKTICLENWTKLRWKYCGMKSHGSCFQRETRYKFASFHYEYSWIEKDFSTQPNKNSMRQWISSHFIRNIFLLIPRWNRYGADRPYNILFIILVIITIFSVEYLKGMEIHGSHWDYLQRR